MTFSRQARTVPILLSLALSTSLATQAGAAPLVERAPQVKRAPQVERAPLVDRAPLGNRGRDLQAVASLPGGGKQVFARKRLLFGYYGFAHPSTTFVLGETNPDRAFAKMRKQGKKLLKSGERLLPVYELVVTVADPDPGVDGDYAHDTLHSKVQEYVDAAHRNGALLVLDLQPGRASFLEVAKRWEWALADPWVGLGLDIEWRMAADEVPGRDIGSVSAREINKVSSWLARLVADQRLPEKVLMFHQYRTGQVRGISRVREPDGVAVVQHVDAPGGPATKQATYDRVARPRQLVTGFMQFLDSDSPVMKPRAVRAVDDAIRFVSQQ